MSTLSKAKPHHRAHALELHSAFHGVERAMRLEKLTQTACLEALSKSLADVTYNVVNEKGTVTGLYTPGTSVKQLTTKFRKWKKEGRTAEALLPSYSSPTGKVSPELTKEIQRRASLPTGGRNKHASSPASVVYKSLCEDWKQGKPVAGFGTWQEWWDNNHPGVALPPKAPDFPLCRKTIDRHMPDKLIRATGNIGAAAGKKHAPYITLDYSHLRKCELLTLDDVRLDILCIDERTARAVEVVCYILMECASRSIIGYICKPKQAIRAADVDELIAYCLQCPGYGIGRDYVTNIIFERGTVACSEAAEVVLEGATDEKIKVRRTGMVGSVRWAGSAADQAVGNSLGKAVIESFNLRLHHALLHLPGQRGNNRDNQPQNLGLVSTKQSSGTGKGKKIQQRKKESNRSQSLVREAEKLARIQILANANARSPQQRVKLNLPMLYFMQLKNAVKAAIKAHNKETGHAYQGHGFFYEAEIAPGVWEETDFNV